MLPENNTYGPWPLSGECEPPFRIVRALTPTGEIDIMEARGNGPTYPAQYVFLPFRSALDRDSLFAEASTTFEDR